MKIKWSDIEEFIAENCYHYVRAHAATNIDPEDGVSFCNECQFEADNGHEDQCVVGQFEMLLDVLPTHERGWSG